MLYDIRAFFVNIPKVGLNAILAMTLFAKPLSVTGFMVLH